jgi:5-methylcytosine-specific restriction endonuclease McrA
MTDDNHGPSAGCTYRLCGLDEPETCPFVADAPSTKEEAAGLAWDYEAIRQMSQEDHDDLTLPPLPGRRKRRIGVRSKVRYTMLREHPYCALCRSRVGDGVRLEIDHIAGNPANNKPANLQVLCSDCNVGKGETPWNVA